MKRLIRSETEVKHYRNKRNPNKYLEVHEDGYGHRSARQYMHWDENDVTNYTGDNNLHRWRKDNMDALLEDYEEIENCDVVASEAKTRTQKLVDRILEEIDLWIEDSFIDKDDMPLENWSELMDECSLTSSEARELIIEALDSDIWYAINHNKPVDHSLSFDDDGEFEDENGNFLKYGQVMSLVKKELVKRGIISRAR